MVDTRGARAIPSSLAAVKRQHPNIGVLVVASENRIRRYCSRRCAPGPTNSCRSRSTRPRSNRPSHASLAHRAASAAAGEVFAFVGAKGGVGTTTAAVNVATALAKVAPSQTLLADLHLTHGDAALLFGAEPRFSIVDALENTHRFDEAFFRGLVTPTKAGPELLASSDRALLPYGDVQRFRAVVEFAAQHVSLRGARRAARRWRRARGAGRRVADRRRREPGTGRRAQREPARDGAPPALRTATACW